MKQGASEDPEWGLCPSRNRALTPTRLFLLLVNIHRVQAFAGLGRDIQASRLVVYCPCAGLSDDEIESVPCTQDKMCFMIQCYTLSIPFATPAVSCTIRYKSVRPFDVMGNKRHDIKQALNLVNHAATCVMGT